MTTSKSDTLTIKIVLVGESGVGKTSIIGSYFDKPLTTYISTNTPIENFKDIELNGKKISISIWDTAGQEVFRSLNKLFYLDANIIIIVYSIDDEKTFEEVKNYWMEDVKDKGTSDKIVALFAHKSDLYLNEEVDEKEARFYAENNGAKFFLTNSTEEGMNCKKEHGFECYMETSAKTGVNVKELFVNCALALYKELPKYMKEKELVEMDGNRVILNDDIKIEENDCAC